MKNLKLNSMAGSHLSQKEMSHVVGGSLCGCGCAYANNGGSSTNDNGMANHKGGKFSTEKGETYVLYE